MLISSLIEVIANKLMSPHMQRLLILLIVIVNLIISYLTGSKIVLNKVINNSSVPGGLRPTRWSTERANPGRLQRANYQKRRGQLC